MTNEKQPLADDNNWFPENTNDLYLDGEEGKNEEEEGKSEE